MKLVELHEQQILSDEEFDVLYEGVAAGNPELKELIATQLAQPFNKTKQDIISKFIPKLKAWAMDAMNKESDTEFVSKVLNKNSLAKIKISGGDCFQEIAEELGSEDLARDLVALE